MTEIEPLLRTISMMQIRHIRFLSMSPPHDQRRELRHIHFPLLLSIILVIWPKLRLFMDRCPKFSMEFKLLNPFGPSFLQLSIRTFPLILPSILWIVTHFLDSWIRWGRVHE